jgi:hypothetical protein
MSGAPGTTGRRSHTEGEVGRLRRLHYWLSYNRYTIVVYGGGFFLPFGLVLGALIVLAVFFAPYLLFVLYKSGKWGWLLAFAIMVGIPLALLFVPTESTVLKTILLFLPLLSFYFYCYILRFSVGEWLSEASPRDQRWLDDGGN